MLLDIVFMMFLYVSCLAVSALNIFKISKSTKLNISLAISGLAEVSQLLLIVSEVLIHLFLYTLSDLSLSLFSIAADIKPFRENVNYSWTTLRNCWKVWVLGRKELVWMVVFELQLLSKSQQFDC